MKKTIFLILILIVLAVSCSKTDTSQASPKVGPLGVKQDIEIKGFAFNPASITISAGTTVIWTNQDSAPHRIISDSGNELGSGSISTGQTYTHTFENPGTYDYHCSIHPSMKGEIVVQSNSTAGNR